MYVEKDSQQTTKKRTHVVVSFGTHLFCRTHLFCTACLNISQKIGLVSLKKSFQNIAPCENSFHSSRFLTMETLINTMLL